MRILFLFSPPLSPDQFDDVKTEEDVKFVVEENVVQYFDFPSPSDPVGGRRAASPDLGDFNQPRISVKRERDEEEEVKMEVEEDKPYFGFPLPTVGGKRAPSPDLRDILPPSPRISVKRERDEEEELNEWRKRVKKEEVEGEEEEEEEEEDQEDLPLVKQEEDEEDLVGERRNEKWPVVKQEEEEEQLEVVRKGEKVFVGGVQVKEEDLDDYGMLTIVKEVEEDGGEEEEVGVGRGGGGGGGGGGEGCLGGGDEAEEDEGFEGEERCGLCSMWSEGAELGNGEWGQISLCHLWKECRRCCWVGQGEEVSVVQETSCKFRQRWKEDALWSLCEAAWRCVHWEERM